MSQFKKAMNALSAKKSNLFNAEYSVSKVGTLNPIESYQKYTNMTSNASSRSKSPANIVQKAFKNVEIQYGSRPSSPYNNNNNNNNNNSSVNTFRPINKSRKSRRTTTRKIYRKTYRKATRKN